MALRWKPLRPFLTGLQPKMRPHPTLRMTACRPYSTDNKNDSSNAPTSSTKSPADYLVKLQATIEPQLTPVLMRVKTARETLKNMTQEINDPKEAIQKAGKALNQLTGYDQIEAVKQKVTNQALAFEKSRNDLQVAKKAYEEAIETRSTTQREINELLQRKHLWTGVDVNRFTELYRLEHEHSHAESTAKESYQQHEKQMDREYMALAQSIMERYHEEQLWSDKIRSVSTYGTWALMVLNLMLFVAVQTVFEPIKRKRLTSQFEQLLVAKVDEEETKFLELLKASEDRMSDQQQQLMQTINERLPLPSAVAADTVVASEPLAQDVSEPLFTADQVDTLPAVDAVNSESNVLPSTTLVDATPVDQQVTDDSSVIVIDKNRLMLYSVESAIVGSLVTAIAMMMWK